MEGRKEANDGLFEFNECVWFGTSNGCRVDHLPEVCRCFLLIRWERGVLNTTNRDVETETQDSNTSFILYC